LQGSSGVHEAFGVHALQVPLLQNWLVPQELPLPTFVPVSMQTGLPLLHESRPTWHLLAGTQVIPSLQVSHDPSRHTRPFPQALPLGWLPSGTH
jgi:hypothetical protein